MMLSLFLTIKPKLLSALYSGVNPFDEPAVKAYKDKIKERLLHNKYIK